MSTHQLMCELACEYDPRGHTESDADFVGEFPDLKGAWNHGNC